MRSIEKKQKKSKNMVVRSAKECAYLAVFVAMLIAMQLVFSAVPGVELITVMFVSYAFAMGAKRAMFAATCFSLLRQMLFGFFPTVLILYLVYFNVLTLLFGLVGQSVKSSVKHLPWLVALACFCTVCFTMLDNIITPLWYAYSQRATELYFYASLPFVFPQVICTAVSVALLFFPLVTIFQMLKRNLLM